MAEWTEERIERFKRTGAGGWRSDEEFKALLDLALAGLEAQPYVDALREIVHARRMIAATDDELTLNISLDIYTDALNAADYLFPESPGDSPAAENAVLPASGREG